MKSRNNYAAKIHNALQRYIFLSVNISSIYIFTNVLAYFSSLYENKVVHLHTNTNLLLMPNKKSCEYENNNAVTGCADAQTSSVKVQVPATEDEIHIICEVHDNSKHMLPAYRRVIIRTK